MEHQDSGRIREEYIKEVLHAGKTAAINCHLQQADCEACTFDFGGHMSLPERWGRWEEVAFSDAWLNACAGNYALNYLKSVSGIVAHETQDTMLASRLLLIVDASADPEHEFMCNEDRGALKTAIARLNGRQRIAISLRYFEDCAVSEIARALGVSDDGARKTISRALRTLHSRLTRTAFDADSALRDFAPPRSGRAAIH